MASKRTASARSSARSSAAPTSNGARSTDLDQDLLRFLDAGPSPYHAAATAIERATAAGAQPLRNEDPWRLEAGSTYVVAHPASSPGGASTVAVFRVGSRPPGEAGFRIVGAHTDSPCLRLKPRPGVSSAGALLLDVEIYGSPILATWADRDLGLAGRVTFERGGRLSTALARVARPFCRVSNVAIHLNRAVNEDGLRLEKGRHLAPMAALLDAGEDPQRAALAAIAEAVGCEPDAVRGFDLCAHDVMPAAFLGRGGEFVASARLDNLASCHAALAAVLAEPADGAPEATALALLFDHEEVGSATAEGAASAWTAGLVERICEARGGAEQKRPAVARSLAVSADMAHAVHPNQPEKHDGVHAPHLNGGPVVKSNASRRYGTDSETGAFFRSLCRAEGVACQEFVSRADMACGSTIGPIVATGLGVRTVDVGNPMLSMHSVRELAGRRDVEPMARVLTRFLAGADPLPW